MNKLVKPGRVAALTVIFAVMMVLYLVFLYQLQIIQGEKYYNQSNEIQHSTERVTAARGNILDRYGRVLVSNKDCYNLKVDVTKLFANEDPNAVILELIRMVEGYGDTYTDDLPITKTPPFEYRDMTDIERTMLEAYITDRQNQKEKLSANPTAVELLSYMRTRYNIDNSYSAEEARMIAGMRYSINVRYSINTADYVFVQDASMKLITSIMENKLNGIQVERSYTRSFNTEYAAHLLGYVGLMTQEEFERYSLLDYANDAVVGKDGVEYAFENELHGHDGEVEQIKNASGTILSTQSIEEPVPGNHIYLTIDIALQEQVERILATGVQEIIANVEEERARKIQDGEYDPTFKDEVTGAAAVVVDVKTGEPLAIASWPTYDPSSVIEDYQKLMEARNTPLFNRALLGAYAPGSTFKPCTAIAVLTEGIINTEFKVKCEGVFTRYAAAGYAPQCWIWTASKSGENLTHPELDVSGALNNSCNYFFYYVGNELGVDDMGKYAHAFGLGNPEGTGIELVETTGNMSNQANHMDLQGQEWRIGDTLQAAIGQSDSIFSPLQLAEYCAVIANGGTRYSASLLKAIRSYDYSDKIYERQAKVLNVVESAEYNWAAVHKGMYDVLHDWAVNEKNAEHWADCKWEVAGKTGTAQKGVGIQNDAIFMCYAPYKDPEVALAIVVERGGAGANNQRIARRIIDAYINIRSYSDTSEAEMKLLK